jgi:O-succinylbenzoate synthase
VHIERIELRYIQLPLKHHFETSFGRVFGRDTILVTVWADGVEGWGESPVEDGPWYSPETVETAWHVQRDCLIPMLLGQRLETAAEAFGRMALVRGHNMAKTGLEEALWDIEARQKGISVAQLLGSTSPRIESGVSVGIQDTLVVASSTSSPAAWVGWPRRGVSTTCVESEECRSGVGGCWR